MQAVILCGGKGTRLSSLFSDRPKILVPVAGRAFLEWQMEVFVRAGVRDFHLAAGHLAGVLSTWLSERSIGGGSPETVDGCRMSVAGVEVCCSLSAEPRPLGTGGGLKYVEPFIRSDRFLAANGDSLLPSLDLSAMQAAHRRIGGGESLVSLAVTRIEESGRYGTVEFDDDGRILAFREKASRTEGWINGGFYLMDTALLATLKQDTPLSLESDVFPDLVRAGRLRSFVAPPPLLDMGTPEGLDAMETFLKARR